MDRTEMDPQAAWLLLLDAMATGHWRVVREQAQDIRDWIELGGIPPNVSNGKVTDQSWNRQVALYACKLARFIARRRLRDNSTRPTKQRA
jgi:hypothetical protein